MNNYSTEEEGDNESAYLFAEWVKDKATELNVSEEYYLMEFI